MDEGRKGEGGGKSNENTLLDQNKRVGRCDWNRVSGARMNK